MPEQVIWPDQADCGGLAWTRTFSWKSDALEPADQTWTSRRFAWQSAQV